jgi:hypothetical protein
MTVYSLGVAGLELDVWAPNNTTTPPEYQKARKKRRFPVPGVEPLSWLVLGGITDLCKLTALLGSFQMKASDE